MKFKINLIVYLFITLFSVSILNSAESNKSIYDFKVKDINGNDVNLSNYKGKVLLIVNVASKCGLTPQYKPLQELYSKFHDRGFEILGFPCNQFGQQEPGTNTEIKDFCSKEFSVTFPLFDKIDVNGDNAHPLYKYLTKGVPGFIGADIKWNFTKFLIDKNGSPIERFEPRFDPTNLDEKIENLLK